jgi:hypothetical protein
LLLYLVVKIRKAGCNGKRVKPVIEVPVFMEEY